MKIGIFGGSFNPPHKGHIQAAEKTVEVLGLDKLLVIPAGEPPHKEMPKDTPCGQERLIMVNAAFSHIACAQVSDYEIQRKGKSYTITTLEHIKSIFPEDELYLMMGTDMFMTLDKWYCGSDILKIAVPAVFARSGDDEAVISGKAREYLEKYNINSRIVDVDVNEIASTDIRELLKNRQGSALLDDEVYSIIIKHRFYDSKPELSWLRAKSYALHKAKRIPHVIGCEEEAAKLAERWGYDVDSAREAGILHDITKKQELREQLLLCEKYGILNDNLECKSEKLLHSKTGAALSRDLFGVADDVYSAIRWHTTGKANMSLLEKIVYLADYVEPNRSFDGVEKLRKLCYEDIDAAMELGLKMSIEELEELGSPIHPKTVEAYNYYRKVKG